jgi:hypothetical protein
LKGDPQGFESTKTCQVAFEFLEGQFTSTPVLRHVDKKEIFLDTVASDFAIACVLSWKYEDSMRLEAILCQKFSPVEVNYGVYDNEIPAIVQCFVH